MFSQKAIEQLKHYVYLYIDPSTDEVFYIGKGRGNRCFTHLHDKSESEKVSKIAELLKLGREPRIEILRYGLTEAEALQVESAAIDLIGIVKLTNRVRGHGSFGNDRTDVKYLNAQLDAKLADIKHPAILININQNFRFGMTTHEIYDATRSAWNVNPTRNGARYALSVFRGVVREVFSITGWVPGGTTMKVTDADGRASPRTGRWEFVGQVAEDDVRSKYVSRSVAHYFKPGARNPILYVNCSTGKSSGDASQVRR
jgi:hypothetical protein